MPANRFILRFRGTGDMPEEDVQRIHSLDQVNVLDSTSRMLLVEAPAVALKKLAESLPEWIVAPEQQYSVPDPTPKVERDSG